MGRLWLGGGLRDFSIVNIFGGIYNQQRLGSIPERLVCPDSLNHGIRVSFPTHKSSMLRQIGTLSTGRTTFQETQGGLAGKGSCLRVCKALQDLLLLYCKFLSLLPISGVFVLKRQCLKILSCEYLLI